MIMGQETPDKGEFKVGPTVKIAYVDQSHKDIDPNKTIYDILSGGAGFTVLSASIRRSAGVHCATTLKNRQHLWHLSYFWADLRLTT